MFSFMTSSSSVDTPWRLRVHAAIDAYRAPACMRVGMSMANLPVRFDPAAKKLYVIPSQVVYCSFVNRL